MRRIAAFILFILTFVDLCKANNYPLPTEPVESGKWERLVIPLKRCGNLLIMEATVDSITGDFIIDTGAPYLILNSTYFRHYPAQKTIQSAGLNDGSVTAVRSTIGAFTANKLHYNHLEVDITGLKQIEDKCNMRILGLIGANMFSSMIMRIDTRTNQLFLYKLDANGNPLTALSDSTELNKCDKSPSVNMRFNWCDNKIMIPVRIAGKEMNWIFDTGAESNVVDAMAQKRILKEFNVLRRVAMTGSTGAKQDVLIGYFDEISVGNTSFQAQQTILTAMHELNETCSVFIDGILGYSFFSKGITTINFKKKEFSLYLYTNE